MTKIPKYKILSHTADLRLEVYGKTVEELFINAAEALADIQRKVKRGKRKEAAEVIKIESANLNILLVDFLNEILARSNINKRVYKVYKVIKLEDDAIEAEIVGVPVKEFDEDVKAITYHNVEIKQRAKIWHTKLVLDI